MSYYDSGLYAGADGDAAAAEKKKHMMIGLAVAVVIGVIILVLFLWKPWNFTVGPFTNARKSKAKFWQQGMPQSTWLGNTPGRQQLTGPIAFVQPNETYGANPLQYQRYMQAVSGKGPNVRANPTGGAPCMVSATNNLPPQIEAACENPGWSQDAISETLALSSIGAYQLEAPENPTFTRLLQMAQDSNVIGCEQAGLTAQAGAGVKRNVHYPGQGTGP